MILAEKIAYAGNEQGYYQPQVEGEMGEDGQYLEPAIYSQVDMQEAKNREGRKGWGAGLGTVGGALAGGALGAIGGDMLAQKLNLQNPEVLQTLGAGAGATGGGFAGHYLGKATGVAGGLGMLAAGAAGAYGHANPGAYGDAILDARNQPGGIGGMANRFGNFVKGGFTPNGQ